MNANIPLTGQEKTFIKNYNYNAKNEDIKFTSIVLLTYNQLPYTKLCIESIRKFTPKGTYEIIVVDNNSTDSTVKWLKKQKDLNVIYNNKNNGFPAGCNQGIRISKGENIILLNNDTIVTPNWLNNLDKALYSSDKIGVVGAVSNSCSNYQQIDVNYQNLDEMFDFAKDYNISNKDMWDYRVKLIGYCYMIKKSVLDEVGLLDEIFTPGNYEDDDLSFRVLKAGYQLLLCRDTFIHHFGSVSFKQEGDKFANVFYENQRKIKEKWGFDSNYSCGFRLDFLQLIADDTKKELNVLDIGCGCGAFLFEVKNKFRNSNIYGIEMCEEAGTLATSVANIKIGNIESMELPYEDKFFDYIFMGDVLEHLNDPWNVLKNLKKYLKEDGYIIVSIPNIMHISVIKTILSGRFPYADSGIFDKTHLRFFTLAEIENLINTSGYKIEAVNGNGVYIPPEDENLIDSLCQLSNPNLRQQYLIYQYVVKSKIN